MTSCMYLFLSAWNQALCEPLHLTKVYLTWHTLSSEAVHIFQSRRKFVFRLVGKNLWQQENANQLLTPLSPSRMWRAGQVCHGRRFPMSSMTMDNAISM